MSLEKSKNILETAVKESYLKFEESIISDGLINIEIRATDPITRAAARVYGKVDLAGNLERIGYQNFGRPFQAGVDISKYITTVWVDVDDPELFYTHIREYLGSPIPLSRNNAQSFVNGLALLPGIQKDRNSSDVALTFYDGGWNTWFEDPISLGSNQSVVENTVINGRKYFGNNVDSLTGQSNINIGMLGGNDFLEVTGGANNFANGNTGEDHIILRGGQGRYLGGKDNDKIEVFETESGSWVNGNRGVDFVTGSIDGVTYRGGADNDILAVSAGTVWGDKGADTFQAIGGGGVAIVQDYTSGEDLIRGLAGGGFTATEQGVAYGVGEDQMLLLSGINDVSQVTLI